MRLNNNSILTLFLLVYFTLLTACSQNQRIINHISTSELNSALDSTIAFIAERNSSEPNQPVRIYCSGFFISERLILSALHCFQDTMTVRLPNGEIIQIPTVPDPRGREFQFVYRQQIEQSSLMLLNEQINEAFVVSIDQETDLAILELTVNTRTNVMHLFLAAEESQVADTVYVIGHPAELAWSTSSGIVSRVLLNRSIIQTNISIIGGYSGGPLINIRGEVVGLADSYIRNVPQVSFFISRQRIQRFLQQHYLHDSR